MERDFAPQGVRFYYIYKSLAHPETNGYIAPFTLEERLQHVSEARRRIGSRITWLCDSMDNHAKHALGDAPNSEFVIDPAGKIVRARQWSRPDQLRADLAELVGPVEKPTTLAEVNMPPLEPPQRAPTGIVARIQVPRRMLPVVVTPESASTDEPYYAKLRAEVDPQYFNRGEGKLYLGFMLDPLYSVHWNNQVAPLAYEIQTPDGISVIPMGGASPKVEQPADADPREFLVDLSGTTDQPLRLTVSYCACDDAETFCKPITQRYTILLQRDRDGGARRAARGQALSSNLAPSADFVASSQRSASLKEAVGLFRLHDGNQDGKLDQHEWAAIEEVPADADADGDGWVSLRELIDRLCEPADDPMRRCR